MADYNDEDRAAQKRFAEMKARIGEADTAAVELIFTEARTPYAWLDEPVTDAQIQRIFDLVKWGPTSANCWPARFLFLRSEEAKERLRPALSSTNMEKTLSAPVVAVVAYDLGFADKLGFLYPIAPDAPKWFAGEEKALETAFRNGTLQGGYLTMAIRAVGLDAAPMSGFKNAVVDEEFFADTQIRSNFICAFGQGDPESFRERDPRFPFDEVSKIL